MVAFSRFVKAVYLFALLLAVYLLLVPAPSQAQFRGTHALPTFFVPTLSGTVSGGGAGGGGGISGFAGGSGIVGGSASGSLSFTPVNLSQIFPNGGRIIGMPPPLFQPMLNNLIFPITADSTGSPLALLIPSGIAGGVGGAGGIGGGIAGVAGGGGIVGGGGGIAGGQGFGGGITGIGGGAGGLGMGGMGVAGGGGGAMGFAGKGMGGFNGRKPL